MISVVRKDGKDIRKRERRRRGKKKEEEEEEGLTVGVLGEAPLDGASL